MFNTETSRRSVVRERQPIFKRLRRRILTISPEEADFARRGFREYAASSREHLEQAGRKFLAGYNAALLDDGLKPIAARLNKVEPEFRGFAYEGAAMGLTLLDCLSLSSRDRLFRFLHGPGCDHIYMAHVGAGWAIARLPLKMNRIIARLDPLLKWLAFDGYGFHEGYFYYQRTVEEQRLPARLSGYQKRAFDQGLGRSLWFSRGADVGSITAKIKLFPKARQADLWSGIGLACAYAGGVEADEIKKLWSAADAYRADLAQGASFAAKARQRAKNMMAHTNTACKILCGMSADAASQITDLALQDLPSNGFEPDYEIWRSQIRLIFSSNRS